MEEVTHVPGRPFLRWAGGKQRLWSMYRKHFAEMSGRFIEPFLGGGSIFFNVSPKDALLGDINKKLIESYQAVRDAPEEVIDKLRQFEYSREVYYWVRDHYHPLKLTEKAARFIYLNQTCWNGLYRENLTGKFNVPFGEIRTGIFLQPKVLRDCSRILQNTQLVAQDFAKTIQCAKPGDFLYCDPPYVTQHNNNGFIEYNAAIFSWNDQKRLAKLCIEQKDRGVKVLISNAAHQPVLDLYPDFEVVKIRRSSTIAGSAESRGYANEVLLKGGF